MSFSPKRSRLIVIGLTALVFLLGFTPLAKYLNSPFYDFAISSLPSPDSSPSVALITFDDLSKLRGDDLANFYQTLEQLNPKGVLFLSYPHEYNDALLKLASKKPNVYFGQPNSLGFDLNLAEHPIPDWVTTNLSVLPIMLPKPDIDGVIRGFDPSMYRKLGLQCSECQVAHTQLSDRTESEFLIRYRLKTKSLPMISGNDLVKGSLPRSVLDNKFLVVANELSQGHGVYTAGINYTRRISFPYYVSSVIDTIINDEKIQRLNNWLLLALLIGIALFTHTFLRFFSYKKILLITSLAVPCWFLINLSSLYWLSIFIPAVEPILVGIGLAILSILVREESNTALLHKTSSILELSLADTTAFQKVSKTDLCASLMNLLNRVVEVKRFRLYRFESTGTSEAISYDDCSNDQGWHEFKYQELIAYTEPEPFIFNNMPDNHQSKWIGIPIVRGKQQLGIIVIESSSDKIEPLSAIYSLYRDEIFDELKFWIEQNQLSETPIHIGKKLLHQSLSKHNAGLIDRLIEKHQSLKQNYNALRSTAVTYDIYGKLVSLNTAAEQFAKRTRMVWYNRPLNSVLQDLTLWSIDETKNVINTILLDKKPRTFTVKAGTSGDYLATLSIETQESEDNDDKQVEKTLLTLEIGNVSKISHASRLKHTFVNDLTDQVKHDLSKAIGLIEKQSFIEDDSLKYRDLLSVLDTLGGRLKSSKTYIDDIASIDSKQLYPVDIANITQAVLTELETKFSEKSVRLVFNRPAFLSLVTLDYRELGFVVSYLIELLLKDSVKNSQIDVSIEEKYTGGGRFISLSIVSRGYGLPQELLRNRQQHIASEVSDALDRCEQFSNINGGEFNIISRAGDGIQVNIKLPITSEVH